MKKEFLALSVALTLIVGFAYWYLLVFSPRASMTNILLEKCLESFAKDNEQKMQNAFMKSQTEKSQIAPWGCEWAASNYTKTGMWKF